MDFNNPDPVKYPTNLVNSFEECIRMHMKYGGPVDSLYKLGDIHLSFNNKGELIEAEEKYLKIIWTPEKGIKLINNNEE